MHGGKSGLSDLLDRYARVAFIVQGVQKIGGGLYILPYNLHMSRKRSAEIVARGPGMDALY